MSAIEMRRRAAAVQDAVARSIAASEFAKHLGVHQSSDAFAGGLEFENEI